MSDFESFKQGLREGRESECPLERVLMKMASFSELSTDVEPVDLLGRTLTLGGLDEAIATDGRSYC